MARSRSVEAVNPVVRGVTRRVSRKPLRRPIGGPPFPIQKMKEALGRRDNRTARVAYYLDWAAQHMPKHYQPFNVILQQVYGMNSMPRLDREEVQALRGTMHGVRGTLQKKYGRDLDIAGNGARATVNDEDTAAVTLPKKLKRLRSAKNSVIATHALIDPSKVRDPRLKAYLNKDVREVIKLVSSPTFDKHLLPPAEAGGDKDKE